VGCYGKGNDFVKESKSPGHEAGFRKLSVMDDEPGISGKAWAFSVTCTNSNLTISDHIAS
jgi:hypothetical protein